MGRGHYTLERFYKQWLLYSDACLVLAGLRNFHVWTTLVTTNRTAMLMLVSIEHRWVLLERSFKAVLSAA